MLRISSITTDPESFYLCKQYFEIALTNQKTEFLNEIISNYLIKKKINIREIEVKMKNEEIRKEKEELKIRKNLEDKIDDVLGKANSCLNNIKNFGKITSVIQKDKKPIKYRDFDKTDEKDPIDIIVSKIKNKYNDKIIINENNMNDYFFNIAKMKNKIKNVKQKNKNLLNRVKHLKKTFSQLYCKSKRNWKPDNTTDLTFYKMINFNYIDLLYKLTSIINTELFEKLYVKLMYYSNKDENIFSSFSNNNVENNNQNSKARKMKIENPNESEYMNTLQDTFSFWYCLKFLLNLIENNKSLTNLNFIFNSVNENALIQNEKFIYNSNTIIEKCICSDIFCFVGIVKNIFYNKNTNIAFNSIIDKVIGENVKKYIKFLNEKNSNKNNQIDEKEIFDKKFYVFYEYALMNIKLNILKLASKKLESKNTDKPVLSKPHAKSIIDYFSKQDLLLFKNFYSILVNNSNYSFSIFKK